MTHSLTDNMHYGDAYTSKNLPKGRRHQTYSQIWVTDMSSFLRPINFLDFYLLRIQDGAECGNMNLSRRQDETKTRPKLQYQNTSNKVKILKSV